MTHSFETDVVQTSGGELKITFLGHGSLMLTFAQKTIHIDPFSRVADYQSLPKADLILITHEHQDHLDPEALASIRKNGTEIVMTELCNQHIDGGIVMRNGDVSVVQGISIEAVPAYNLIHTRESGDPFHPCGNGNGYVLTFGDTRVYVAGDSENTPEMLALRNIDIAFLPMNLPYTMTPAMVAEAAIAMKPRILYPYHFGRTDTSELVDLLASRPETDVRIRKMA
ncbi:MBL fold metallo-hydrolase [Candidatus Bipolaricaulota bacterium]|nr:MBL fold metallo-hydrolase [Candidatus Bipolaricaulota bacterium]TFH08581.1 MAG: MBL fold metallo-hydrolase [Candidatus Atribacteria bacterium]